jgi:DNA repair exonuclease SbcCD ATPase subunit
MTADELLKKTVAAIKKDPLGRPQVADAFEQARVGLRRDARRMRSAHQGAFRSFERAKKPIDVRSKTVAQSQDKMVASLEKNVVYLADLLNDQRMIDAEALAKELREQQQALKKALEDYKNAPTEEKRKVLADAIKEIRNRIDEITKEMAKLSSQIPQDFMNTDALEMKGSQQQMDEVQRMLEEGDLEGAMQALDRMLQQTEQMLSQLQEGREELGSREYSEMFAQAQQLWEDLEKVERDQRDLAQKTEKMSKDILDRMKDRLGDPKSFVEKQVKRLEQAQAALERVRPDRSMPDSELYETTEARLEDGKRALEARDFGAAREVLERAEQQMNQLEQEARRRVDHSRRFGDFFGVGKSAERMERELRKSRPVVEQVLEDIEKLMPPPDTLMSEQERQRLSQYQRRQQELEGRAKQLGEDLDRLGQQLPIVGPQVKEMVEESRQAMGDAEQLLGGGDAPAALNQERRALDALRRLKDELQKMGEQNQGGQGGQGSVPLPFGQSQSQGGEGPEGPGQNSMEKVEIPQPDQYKAPAEFREDILEAAKQGTVEQYRDAVRRYYEELVK